MRICCRLPVVVLLPVIAMHSAAANDDTVTEDDAYRRCISTSSIRSTTVKSDRHIVFNTSHRKIYLNTLRSECHGLSREGRFTYTIYGSNLCQSDMIRVLNYRGVGLQQGRSCRLGRFQLVTKEDIADLFEDRDLLIEPKEVETPDVEDIASDDDSSEDDPEG